MSSLRPVLAVLLLAEGLLTGVWLAGLLPQLAAQDLLPFLLVLARGLSGVFQAAGGWLLLQRAPPAVPLAQVGVVSAAAISLCGIGFRLMPTNLDPSFRWPIVIGYGTYALTMSWLLRRLR